MKRIRVLIVEGSHFLRERITRGLGRDAGLEVIAAAGEFPETKAFFEKYKPDVAILSLDLQGQGTEYLRKVLAHCFVPAVVVGFKKEQACEALSAGASDFLLLPTEADPGESEELIARELAVKVKLASTGRQGKELSVLSAQMPQGGYPRDRVIAIGASTGGTEAIFKVVSGFGRDIPGVVIVQHMPPGFTQMYAERLNTQCQIDAKEAETGDLVLPGRVLIAPGDAHMRLLSVGGQYQVECKTGAKVSGHCPSVDVLFESVAKTAGRKAIGILLTGMGADGAKGLLSMRNAGAETIGQDAQSCIVYGMPKEAFNAGAVKYQLSLEMIAGKVYQLLNTAK